MVWLMEILRIYLEEQFSLTFDITKNPEYDEYQKGLASMAYKFFDKKSSSLAWSETSATRDKSDPNTNKRTGISFDVVSENKELIEEILKPIIRKFEKRKVNSHFIDNIWGADLADMQLLRKFNKGIRLSVFAFDIYSKYAWLVHLKDKKGITITGAFQKILNESGRKPHKIFITNH